jgi:hypothetical protein
MILSHRISQERQSSCRQYEACSTVEPMYTYRSSLFLSPRTLALRWNASNPISPLLLVWPRWHACPLCAELRGTLILLEPIDRRRNSYCQGQWIAASDLATSSCSVTTHDSQSVSQSSVTTHDSQFELTRTSCYTCTETAPRTYCARCIFLPASGRLVLNGTTAECPVAG